MTGHPYIEFNEGIYCGAPARLVMPATSQGGLDSGHQGVQRGVNGTPCKAMYTEDERVRVYGHSGTL